MRGKHVSGPEIHLSLFLPFFADELPRPMTSLARLRRM